MKTRVHPDEKQRIEAAATRAGLRPSGFLAVAALAAAAGDDFTRDAQLHEVGRSLSAARTDLARIGNNINQIARALNIDQATGSRPTDALTARHEAALTALTRTLQRLDAAAWDLTERKH
jgi:hypothetical protein